MRSVNGKRSEERRLASLLLETLKRNSPDKNVKPLIRSRLKRDSQRKR